MFKEIRSPDGHLLARIDPERKLLELQRKKTKVLVDLMPYLQENGAQPAVESQQQPQVSK
jgi:hypothetical protein